MWLLRVGMADKRYEYFAAGDHNAVNRVDKEKGVIFEVILELFI